MLIFTQREWSSHGEIVVFGAGLQAEWHIRLALLFGPSKGGISKISVINRSVLALENLRKRCIVDLQQRYSQVQFSLISKEGNSSYQTELKKTLQTAKAIFCCTPSTEPLFPHDYLVDGGPILRYISLIGSYKPHMQEVEKDTLLSSKYVYVDAKDACLAEAGELIKAELTNDNLVEIGDIFEGRVLKDHWDRSIKNDNVVFKCVGMGIMDINVGEGIIALARKSNKGREITEF